MGAAGKYGPELGSNENGDPWVRVGSYRLDGIRYQDSPFMDVDLRLKRMAACGIDFQVLSPNPLTYFHFIDPQIAIEFCRTHNNALAEIVRQHPGQLAGLAAVPMQAPAAAAEELERAVTELGLLGSAVGSDMPLPLESREFDCFYETCSRLDVPLFVHPAPQGLDGPPGDPRLKEFDLDIILGFAAQETLIIAHLIIGGVLERHPQLDICVSHGGGSIALLAERLADGTRRRPWSPAFLRGDGDFEAYLARFWVDNHVHDPQVLALLTKRFSDDQIVLGTNFAGWDAPAGIDREAPHIQRLADNARRLLRTNINEAP